MFLGFRVSEMINVSTLRLEHNNCQASVNSVGGWGAGPVIQWSRSQKHISGGDVCRPLSWENSALSNIKCIWTGTLGALFLFSELWSAPLSPEVRARLYFFNSGAVSVDGVHGLSEKEALYSSVVLHVKSIVPCVQGLSCKGHRHGSSNSPSLWPRLWCGHPCSPRSPCGLWPQHWPPLLCCSLMFPRRGC